ncbi:hypothetical protein BH10ACI3_BH10ACI3_23820 [soil metagenome]
MSAKRGPGLSEDLMKMLSEQKALERLQKIRTDLRSEIVEGFEHRAKSCQTCDTKGACCLDAHFVNVHISRLEARAIGDILAAFSNDRKKAVYARIEETIEKYGLTGNGDTYSQTFACPLFEKGTGCLVHEGGKPLPCITHACYESAADLPPEELLAVSEKLVDSLNEQTYGQRKAWLPLPLALKQQ